MKKLFTSVLLAATLTLTAQAIQTQKVIKTQIKIHNYPYAEAELEQDKTTMYFTVARMQGISTVKSFVLTPYNTELLYQSLLNYNRKKSGTIDIETQDNKILHIEYKRYMFETYVVFDIIDKLNDSVYHIYDLGTFSLNKLFNKNN